MKDIDKIRLNAAIYNVFIYAHFIYIGTYWRWSRISVGGKWKHHNITYTGLTRSDRERDIVLKQATCIVNMECILDIKNSSYNGQFQLHRNIWNCSVTYFSTVNNIQRVNVRVPLVWLEICICICFLIGLAILYWGRVVWQVADWSGKAPVFGQKCCIHPNHSALCWVHQFSVISTCIWI